MLKKGDVVRLTSVDEVWEPEIKVGDVGVIRSFSVNMRYVLVTMFLNGNAMAANVEDLEKLNEPDQ